MSKKAKKIGFDISMLVYVGSGVATYTYNLVKALLKVDRDNEYHLFYSSLRRPKNFYFLDELERLGGKIHSFRLPPRVLRFLWGKKHILPIEYMTGKTDYFHTSDFLRPPLFKGTAGITTVHDLTWKIYPKYHEDFVVSDHERKLKKTVKYKDLIICPSNSTKADLCKYYPGVEKDNIYVIPEGVDSRFEPKNDKRKTKQILKKYKIKSPYIVYVGAIEPRKNLLRLINAFSELIKYKKFGDFSLVIGGRAGWKNKKVFERPGTLGIEDRVVFCGFVEDEDLPFLLSSAECLAYVSLYEGFGLPPLEAQACGCPVTASNVSSLPEVLGSSSVLVDPYNKNEICKGLIKTIEDKEKIRKAGFDNQKKFTWEKSAEGFLKILDS